MEIDKLKFKLIKILISLSGQNQENLILKYNIKGTFAHYDNNFLFYFKLSKIINFSSPIITTQLLSIYIPKLEL